jgi:hypothetical protein
MEEVNNIGFCVFDELVPFVTVISYVEWACCLRHQTTEIAHKRFSR